MQIIGLSGKKKCGKSYVATYIENMFPVCKRISFADKLKTVVTELFSLEDECYDPDKKEIVLEQWGVTPRTLMQKIGTEMFRNTLQEVIPDISMPYNSIWVTNVHNQIISLNPKYVDCVIIDDVRFPDEYDCIRNLGGKVIEIIRPFTPTDMDSHASEGGCPADFRLQNTTAEEISEQLRTYLKHT